MTLSTKVLIGLALGILAGMFFGEIVSPLGVIGDVFIQLLQMTVLPYVVVSLIVGLGRLKYGEAISLAKTCGALLIATWGLTLMFVLLMPPMFPEWETASLFSTTLVEERRPFNFMELYIPANPFYSLANNLVPGVVLFSIAIGVALIGVENKHNLIETLSVAVDVLMRVTSFVVNLAPLGIFAIAASAAGTMDVEDIGRWQVYLWTYVVIWAVLAFWVLPALVTSLTPLTYREVVGSTRDVLITAFATGNLLIVLPVLAEKSKELLKRYNLDSEDTHSAVGVIVPTSFTLPNSGKLLTLSFILFAGWFTDTPVSVADYPTFASVGFFTFFGSVPVAIPFLLDLFRIPTDMFQLFVVSDVLISRFGTQLAAMHTLVLALLGPFALSKRLTVRWTKLIRYAMVTIVLGGAAVAGMTLLFAMAPKPDYTKYQTFTQMSLLHNPVPATVLKSLPPQPPQQEPAVSRLQAIEGRGVMRVGYFKDTLPLAFSNSEGQLVGLGVEMAHLLAKELNVSLEFVLLNREEMAKALKDGQCDMIVSGIVATPQHVHEIDFSTSFMDATFAFVAKDYRRHEFGNWEDIKKMKGLTIGLPNESPYFVALLQQQLPNATVMSLTSPRAFFKNQEETLDALVYGAEQASAWTLVYPEFTVVVPRPIPLTAPVVFPLPLEGRELNDFVKTWITLKKKDGTMNRLFDHWIQGKTAGDQVPRWSIIRNVLHWVE